MRPTHAPHASSGSGGFFTGPEGSCGRLVVSWVIGGGIATGGILVSLLTVVGVVSPGVQLLAAPVLFLLGSCLGAIHGGLLAVAGRPETLTRGAAARRALLAGLISVPLTGAAWVVTAAVSLTAALVGEWHLGWGLAALGGWALGLALCVWAAVEGWRALRRVYARWPECRLGTALTVAILVVSSVLLVRAHPSVWGTELKLNGFGSVALALAVTLWVGLPAVWGILHVIYGWHAPRKIPHARA